MSNQLLQEPAHAKQLYGSCVWRTVLQYVVIRPNKQLSTEVVMNAVLY
jgi:hypothetical protein